MREYSRKHYAQIFSTTKGNTTEFLFTLKSPDSSYPLWIETSELTALTPYEASHPMGKHSDNLPLTERTSMWNTLWLPPTPCGVGFLVAVPVRIKISSPSIQRPKQPKQHNHSKQSQRPQRPKH